MFTKAQKRCYQRLICGFRRHGNKRLRFLTLTTHKNFEGNINECFVKLRKRINKLNVNMLLRMGYLDKKDVTRYYGSVINFDSDFPFEYLKVTTSEGNKGVIHCLYFGRFIPQKWISDSWNDITGGSYIVDIRECKRRIFDPFKLAMYCVSQYVSGQSKYLKFNCSQNWCFKGFIKTWYGIKKVFYWRYTREIMDYVIDCIREGVEIDSEYVRSFPKRN